MMFEAKKSEILSSNVQYVSDDHSFSTSPWPDFAASLVLGNVELLVGLNGRVLGLSGYCPRSGWLVDELTIPVIDMGSVYFRGNITFDGIARRYMAEQSWKAVFDPKHRLVCISRVAPFVNGRATEVSKGFSLLINEGELVQIWISLK